MVFGPVLALDCNDGSPLERGTVEGDSPVRRRKRAVMQSPRVACIGLLRVKLGEPTPNLKYILKPIVN